jgi:hypothetical protein
MSTRVRTELWARLVPGLSRRHRPHFSRRSCGGRFGRRNLGVAWCHTPHTKHALYDQQVNQKQSEIKILLNEYIDVSIT